MTLQLNQVLSHLQKVRKSGAGWSARCPVTAQHSRDDKKNSLSITSKNGKVLLHCFTGCTYEQITAALDGQRHNNRTGKKAERKFPYTDGEVTKLAEALIDEWKSGGEVAGFLRNRGITHESSLALRLGATHRTFNAGSSPALAIPLYHDGKLVGVKYRSVRKKDFLTETGSDMSGLYGRPDLSAKEVLLLEGPLDVALAMSHGFNAVGIQAADTIPSKPDVNLLGQYPTVFITGDSDRAGREAMNRWQMELNADYAEALIRVNLGGYKDIGELHAADPPGFPTALRKILRQARASRDYFEPEDLLAETELRGVNISEPYAVELLIPRQRLSMLFGEEKGGKSLLATYVGKCVGNGLPLFGKYATTQMPVLYLDLENMHDELAANAALFARLGPVELTYRTRQTGVPALNAPGLIRYCEKYKPLLILDSQTKFTGAYFERKLGGKGSQWNPDHMSGFFDELLDLCAAGATILIIHHCTRDEAERYANSYMVGASVARAFAVISEDRPQLKRVRLQGVLFRGAEPVSEQLVGFPVVAETGHFGLADISLTPVDRLVEFVSSKGGQCSAEDCKTRKGIRRERATALLNQAVDEGRLLWKKRGPVSVPNPGTEAYTSIPFPPRGTDGTEDGSNVTNVK